MPARVLKRTGSVLGMAAAAALMLGTIASAGPPVPPAAPQANPASPASASEPSVQLGIEALLDDPDELARLDGQNVGLITNPTGTDSELNHSMDLLIDGEDDGGYELTALYAPEHGILGGADAGEDVDHYDDPRTGLTVWSLYGDTQRPTEEMLEDVDVLLFDIQDIGARFYTYIWTLYYAMGAAGEYDKDFIVLDRPNPLGDRMDGPVLDPDLSSFVGLREIPMQHGLTVGELASLFNGEFLTDDDDEEPVADFHVVTMDGYDPADFTDGYGLPWVLPSPNVPNIETAWAYAGTGLIEALDASEGRGTTTPFLWTGHQEIDEAGAYELADDLNSRGLEGVTFRPMFTTPTTSKQEGEMSGGVQLHITDPEAYVPVRTGLHVLSAMYHTDGVDWREETDLYPDASCDGQGDTCWIDQLTGDKNVRAQIEQGVDPDEIIAGWDEDLADFDALAEGYRLYQGDGGEEPEPTQDPSDDDLGDDSGADQSADADADEGADGDDSSADDGADEGADASSASDDSGGNDDAASSAGPGAQDQAAADGGDENGDGEGGMPVTGLSVTGGAALALTLGVVGALLARRRQHS